MAVDGVVFYNYGWNKLISLENLNEEDYLEFSDTAKISYKIYSSFDIYSAQAMLLSVELEKNFIEGVNDDEVRIKHLEDLMTTLSNMAPNTNGFSPIRQYYENILGFNIDNDLFAIKESLFGLAGIVTASENTLSLIIENDEEIKPTFKSVIDEFYCEKEDEEAKCLVHKC